MKKYIYGFLLLFIALVSSFDVYVTVRLSEHIAAFEDNPFQEFLMVSTGSVAFSVAIRAFLTTLSVAASVLAFNLRDRMRSTGWICVSIIASIHVYLLYLLIVTNNSFKIT